MEGFARVGSTTNDEASALSKLCVEEAPLYRPCSTALLGERTWLGSGLGLGLGLGLGWVLGLGLGLGLELLGERTRS